MEDINYEESYKESMKELNMAFDVIFTDESHKAFLNKEGTILFLHISGILDNGYAKFPLRIFMEITKLLKTGFFKQDTFLTNGTISLELNLRLEDNIESLNKLYYIITEIKKIYSMEL